MKKTALIKLLLLTATGFSVAGCGILPPPGPECVSATDFGDVTTATFDVDSQSGTWVNTNISVDSNSLIQISVEPGTLMLCGKTENQLTNVESKNSKWTPTNIFVRKNDQLTISVNKRSTIVTDGPGAGHYTRYGGSDHEDGNGLNIKVGGGIDDGNCHDGTCNDGGIILPEGGTKVEEKGMLGYSGLPLDTSLITNIPAWSPTGQGLPLYLRVYDEGNYGNNQGGYVASINHYGCPRYNGENLRMVIHGNSGFTAPFSTQPDAGMPIGDTKDLGPTATQFRQSTRSTETGTIWLKIYDLSEYTNPATPNASYNEAPGDGLYSNNAGSYKVKVTVVSLPPEIISGAINGLVKGVKTKLDTAQEIVFGNIVHGTQLVRIINALLALYIIIYGIMFMYGMIEHTQMDFLIRVVKIGIIIQLTSATSYHFFNTYVFSLFTEGSAYLIHAMSNAYTIGQLPPLSDGIKWTFLDQTFSQLFSQSTWIKLAGLLFAFPLGWIYLILIIIAMAHYIIAVAWVILTYLLSLVAISLLIAVSPIFIIFLLFSRTAVMFKHWLNQLFYYALTPVVLIAMLTIFNYFVVSALLRVLNFGVCWKCIWDVDIGFKLCLWNFYSPVNWVWKDPINTLPITIIDILILFMFVKMLPKIINYSERLSRQLTSAVGGSSLTSVAKGLGTDASQKLKSTVGLDDKSRNRRKQAAANQKLQQRARSELDTQNKGGGGNK